MKIIDTHQHLWDRSRLDLPWLKDAGEPLGKSHLPSDYAKASEGLGIVQTIYMEVDVRHDQRVDEAKYVYGLCADPHNPMVGAVVGGDPAHPEFGAYLDKIASPYLKGVRQVLHGGLKPGYCTSPAFVAGVRELGKRGLRFDLCLRPGELADGATLAKSCPETRFVLDHCGNAPVLGTAAEQDAWRRGMEQVAAQSHVICKISGIIAGTKAGGAPFAEQLAPFIDFSLDTFGPDRVIFASDWPVCTLKASLAEWVGALKTIVARRSEADQRKLFFDNAHRFYGLK